MELDASMVLTLVGMAAALTAHWLAFGFKIETLFRDMKDVVGEDHRIEQAIAQAIEKKVTRVQTWIDNIAHEHLQHLFDWHNVKDSDGVPVWYVRKSVEKLISEVANTAKQAAETNREVANTMREIRDEMAQTHRAIEGLLDALSKMGKN